MSLEYEQKLREQGWTEAEIAAQRAAVEGRDTADANREFDPTYGATSGGANPLDYESNLREQAAAAEQNYNDTAFYRGTTYEESAADHYDPNARDMRNFMYGRNPAAADATVNLTEAQGNNAVASATALGEQSRVWGTEAGAAAAQQALDAGQYGRDQGAAVQGQAQGLQNYALNAAAALGGSANQIGATGQAYSGALTGAGATAAALGGQLGQAATQQGAQNQQALVGSANRAAAVGQAANEGLFAAGGQAAQASSQAASQVSQAGAGANTVGSSVRSDLGGAAERGRIAGQQALGGLGNAGSTALQGSRDANERLTSIAGEAAGRSDVQTNFIPANQALGGATSTAERASQTAAGAGQQVAQDGLERAQSTAADLSALEAQQGPSAAQAQLRLGTNRAINQQVSMARSGRGLSGNANAMDNAGRNIATIQSDAANQAAGLRAQEDAAWRQRQQQALALGGQLNVQAGQLGLGAGQLGLAGGQLSTEAQLAAAGQQGQQAQFQTQSAIQQQALRDQTSLAYNQAAVQARMTGNAQQFGALEAGDPAHLAGLGINTQALTAGGSAALPGGGINALSAALAGGLMGLGWLLGTKLDQMWGTDPTMLCLCVLAGTLAGFFHLITVARRLE
jgi:hypothetical protein